MIQDLNKHIKNSGKKPIVFDAYYTPAMTPKPVIIFCHGYKGFKDWGAWHLVATAFVKAGFFFVKFNFSHNGGTLEQPVDFPDLESFAQNNYSIELDDLDQVISYLSAGSCYASEADGSNISLVGHSRGGGIVLIKAQEDPRIRKVVSWAGVSDYKIRFNEGSDAFLQWKKVGRTYVENGRTKQQMPHDWQFYEDFVKNEERLTISRAMKQLQQPCLIVHGDKDTTVPIEEAKLLHVWNRQSRLEIIHNADHVFGANHPWLEPNLPAHLETTVNTTTSFLNS